MRTLAPFTRCVFHELKQQETRTQELAAAIPEAINYEKLSLVFTGG